MTKKMDPGPGLARLGEGGLGLGTSVVRPLGRGPPVTLSVAPSPVAGSGTGFWGDPAQGRSCILALNRLFSGT